MTTAIVEAQNGSPVFAARSVTHDYSGVVVLSDVDVLIQGGAVQALVGENGSGKSTLIKILTGALKPAKGSLDLNGAVVAFATPAKAQEQGIGVVHQGYNLFPDLTVAENVFRLYVRSPRRRLPVLVDRHAINERVRAVSESLGLVVDPTALVRSLALSDWKFIEIARAMLLEPRFLILDEPTASLEPRAAGRVLALMDRLRSQGVGVCFVSHRLHEVLDIADRITVLRDGRVVGDLTRGEASDERLAQLIIGKERGAIAAGRDRDWPEEASAAAVRTRGVALHVSGIRLADDSEAVDLEVLSGEIVGLTGLVGSGAVDVAKMMGGAVPLSGDATVYGRRVEIRTPRDAKRAGIGFIAEDRASGIVPDQSVAINIALASLSSVAPSGVLSRSKTARIANEYKEKLGIRFSSIHAPAKTLSGGNAQKLLIARWLASGVRVLVVVEPTTGMDVGARAQVYALLDRFVATGGAVVVASTDPHEILTLCDRVAVFHHGSLTEELSPGTVVQDRSSGAVTGDAERFLEQLIAGAHLGRLDPSRMT